MSEEQPVVLAVVRPVGTWVIAGFLTLASLVTWGLVAALFHARS